MIPKPQTHAWPVAAPAGVAGGGPPAAPGATAGNGQPVVFPGGPAVPNGPAASGGPAVSGSPAVASMPTLDRSSVAVEASLLLTAIVWGLNFPVLKVALHELNPMVVNAVRFPLAALVVAVLLRAQGRRLIPRHRDWPQVVALGVLGHFTYQLCFVYGLSWTLAGNAALLMATTPVWVVCLAGLLREERFSPRALCGALVTLAGTVVLVANGPGGEADAAGLGATLRGDLVVLAGVVIWAAYTVLIGRSVKRHGALEVTGWTFWAASPFIFLAGVPSMWTSDLGSVSAGAWAAVAYSGVLTVGLGYFAWYRAVGVIGQSRTAVYANFVPVVTFAGAWLWLGETPTAAQLGGTAVVLAGLAVARRGGAAQRGARARAAGRWQRRLSNWLRRLGSWTRRFGTRRFGSGRTRPGRWPGWRRLARWPIRPRRSASPWSAASG